MPNISLKSAKALSEAMRDFLFELLEDAEIQEVKKKETRLSDEPLDNTKVPAAAIIILERVLLHGASKGLSGWRERPLQEHINHAQEHLEKWNEAYVFPHLTHAFCRLMMAAVIEYEGQNNLRGNTDG